jgi:hypothetical protein
MSRRVSNLHIEPAFPEELEFIQGENAVTRILPIAKRVWGDLPAAGTGPAIVMVHGDDCGLRHGGRRCTCDDFEESSA